VLTKIIHNKFSELESEKNICRPEFFRIYNAADAEKMEQLLTERPWIRIYDTIEAQLRELVKSLAPKETLTDEDIASRIKTHIDGKRIEEYGVWVYYPWNDKLVHLLDEQEFVFMRTNRNKYKITDEEEEILSTKIIGVVGLSVGQSVSVTMAMERTFGELRIADFDELEITNLNRLRSSVYNMGLKKTVQVTRDILEIDPFLKITVFSEGLHAGNMDAFFTEGGKLDLIIDECDGLDIKILLRHKAKALGVPVLMEASDRGTVDVERFDLEPDRPILHGFIDHLDHTKIGSLTNDEKIPYIMPMLGLETISKRLRASMVEIKQTISTWPQLASAVTLGGALCADVCRRIMLGKYNESGRYFVDIEELIGNKKPTMEGSYEAKAMHYPELTTDEMTSLIASVNKTGADIPEDSLKKIAEAAIWAPSAGNNQPWKLMSANGVLYIFHDRNKSYSWTDKLDFIARISLGAAIENAMIMAESMGYLPDCTLLPAGEDKPLVAAISFVKGNVTTDTSLASYIGSRCTNRKKGDNTQIPAATLDKIKMQAETIAGAGLTFLTDSSKISEFADIESAAERIRSLHPQSHYEFFLNELRWNETGKEKIYEGLDIKTLEMTVAEEMGMKIASDPAVIALINEWHAGRVFEKNIRNAIKSSSAVGLVTIPGYSAAGVLNGGRGAQRAWLAATGLELALQPISAPLFLHYTVKYGDMSGERKEMIEEIEYLFGKLCILFPELNTRHGLFLFRLFNAEPPTARSQRKHLEELYTLA